MKDYMKEQDDWRAKDDMDTLRRAEEIKADKARHGAAVKKAQQAHAALGKIANVSKTKPAAKPAAKPASRGKGRAK